MWKIALIVMVAVTACGKAPSAALGNLASVNVTTPVTPDPSATTLEDGTYTLQYTQCGTTVSHPAHTAVISITGATLDTDDYVNPCGQLLQSYAYSISYDANSLETQVTTRVNYNSPGTCASPQVQTVTGSPTVTYAYTFANGQLTLVAPDSCNTISVYQKN